MIQLKKHLFYLVKLDEHRRDATSANEEHKYRNKSQYDKSFCLQIFSEGDLVLVYDQKHD